MLTFLFWNINKNPIVEIIKNLVDQHQVDVLMLVECTIPTHKMLDLLNSDNQSIFYFSESQNKRISIYTRFPREFIVPVTESNRLTIRRLKHPNAKSILLAVTHLPSKFFWSNESQNFEIAELADIIRLTEEREGHQRTVLVGDFNMNPFETGIVAASGLSAISSKKVAKKGYRTIQNKKYPFFYNPMWGHFGDSHKQPPGTYYYERAEHVNYYWHIFDQILIRPDLISKFSNNKLKILYKDNNASFLSRSGIPNSTLISDHLPILFKLDI